MFCHGVSGDILLLPCFIEIPVFNANSVDPSDLSLHCLPMSLLWNARNKWVNMLKKTNFYILYGASA